MTKFNSEELGRVVALAENGTEGSARDRLQKRLRQDRVPSTRVSTTSWVNWNYMAEVLGQPFDVSRIPISKLEQMRRDPMLSFGLTFSKIPLIRAPWMIKSTDPQRAAFIDHALRRIYGRFILAYTNCFDFGYSAIVKRFELSDDVDWTYVDKDDLDGGDKPVWESKVVKPLLWKPFLSLSPRAVTPHWNAAGEFAGIDLAPPGSVSAFGTSGMATNNVFEDQRTRQGKPADIPLDWALWATNEKDSVFGSLWGYPRIGYAYRFWWSYWYKFGLAERAFEKWADPPVAVWHPADDGLDADGNAVNFGDEALALAEQLRSGANVALPSDVVRGWDDRALNLREWAVEQLESKANFDALNAMFEYLDVQKLRAVMVPEQALVEGKGGTSSRNVAATFGDLFQEAQAVVMQEIDDHINRYMIPQLLEANFGPGGAPCTKVTTGFDPQDIDTMRQIVGAIANRETETLPIDMRELLDRLGIPLLSHAAFQRELDKRAEEAAAMRPPETEGQNGPGAQTAGVNKQGLYYAPRERITLSDKAAEKIEEVIKEDAEEEGKKKRFLGIF